jgi:hypothetical protein
MPGNSLPYTEKLAIERAAHAYGQNEFLQCGMVPSFQESRRRITSGASCNPKPPVFYDLAV